MNIRSKPASIHIVFLSIGLFAVLPSVAQQQKGGGKPASHAEDPVYVARYIEAVEGEIKKAEARVSAVSAQLIDLDQDIEDRINRMVSLISSVRDSNSSGSTRIRMMKKDIIEGLEKTARFYVAERDKREKEMGKRYSSIESDELARDVAALNSRIEERIEQALDITASLTRSREMHGGKYRNYHTDYSGKTKEYRRTEKDANASVKMTKEFIDLLKEGIEKLERENQVRKNELNTATDPHKIELLTKDIQATREMILTRRNQIEKAMTQKKPTRPVSSKAAFETDKLIDEMGANLKMDFMKFRSLLAERDRARARVKPLKDRLARAKAAQTRLEPKQE